MTHNEMLFIGGSKNGQIINVERSITFNYPNPNDAVAEIYDVEESIDGTYYAVNNGWK